MQMNSFTLLGVSLYITWEIISIWQNWLIFGFWLVILIHSTTLDTLHHPWHESFNNDKNHWQKEIKRSTSHTNLKFFQFLFKVLSVKMSLRLVNHHSAEISVIWLVERGVIKLLIIHVTRGNKLWGPEKFQCSHYIGSTFRDSL